MENLSYIILPEGYDPNRYREVEDALGLEINMLAHPSEQEEIMKNYLFIQKSLHNMLCGEESVTDFLDKVEATDCIAIDTYLEETLENLELLGIS